MRITYLSTMRSFYGGEVHLAALAFGMRRRGHEVRCVVRPGSALAERLEQLGLEVHTLPLTHWFEVGAISRLAGLLRSTGTQILHSHLPRDYYSAAVAGLGSPVVNVGTRHQLRPISLPRLKQPFLGRFHTMITVSEAVRRAFLAGESLPPERVVTIPNGTVLPPGPVSAEPQAGPLRLACGAAPGDPVVGFVGRLTPAKGLETAIRAVAELAEAHPRVKLCVVGDGKPADGYARKLRRLAAQLGVGGRVHFLGYRSDAQQAALEFNVQVVPSRAEPFGLVTIEAMARGRPVVVTGTGGSPEIVRDGVEGFLIPPGDWRRLAARLSVLLDAPGLAAEMGRHGRRRVAARFTLEGMLERTERTYRQALADLPVSPLREDEQAG